MILSGAVTFVLTKQFQNMPATTTAHAEHAKHTGVEQGSAQTPAAIAPTEDGVLDGAKNPNLISVSKAYEVFLNSVSVPSGVSISEKENAKDKFRRAELDEQDDQIVMEVLSAYHSNWVNITALHEQLLKNQSSPEEFAKLKAQAETLITSTQQTLARRLSKDGAVKLHEHVLGLRSKIKVYTKLQGQ